MRLSHTATLALLISPVSVIDLNPKVVPAGITTGVARISVYDILSLAPEAVNLKNSVNIPFPDISTTAINMVFEALEVLSAWKLTA